jgi:hypothetical protein
LAGANPAGLRLPFCRQNWPYIGPATPPPLRAGAACRLPASWQLQHKLKLEKNSLEPGVSRLPRPRPVLRRRGAWSASTHPHNAPRRIRTHRSTATTSTNPCRLWGTREASPFAGSTAIGPARPHLAVQRRKGRNWAYPRRLLFCAGISFAQMMVDI